MLAPNERGERFLRKQTAEEAQAPLYTVIIAADARDTAATTVYNTLLKQQWQFVVYNKW